MDIEHIMCIQLTRRTTKTEYSLPEIVVTARSTTEGLTVEHSHAHKQSSGLASYKAIILFSLVTVDFRVSLPRVWTAKANLG